MEGENGEKQIRGSETELKISEPGEVAAEDQEPLFRRVLHSGEGRRERVVVGMAGSASDNRDCLALCAVNMSQFLVSYQGIDFIHYDSCIHRFYLDTDHNLSMSRMLQ